MFQRKRVQFLVLGGGDYLISGQDRTLFVDFEPRNVAFISLQFECERYRYPSFNFHQFSSESVTWELQGRRDDGECCRAPKISVPSAEACLITGPKFASINRLSENKECQDNNRHNEEAASPLEAANLYHLLKERNNSRWSLIDFKLASSTVDTLKWSGVLAPPKIQTPNNS